MVLKLFKYLLCYYIFIFFYIYYIISGNIILLFIDHTQNGIQYTWNINMYIQNIYMYTNTSESNQVQSIL